MNENCFDSEYVGEVIVMDDKLKEFYFSNIESHNNDILKTLPLFCLAAYGSIISDPFINIENESIKTIVFNMFEDIKKSLNSQTLEMWEKDYSDIINSEKNITDDFIRETIVVSELIFSKSLKYESAESYSLYWKFMCVVVALFPKEVYGLIEVERVFSNRFKTLYEALSFTKKALNLQVALINDVTGYKTKCFKKINTLYSIKEDLKSSDKWNKDIPNYFVVAIILTFCRCEYINYREEEFNIGKIIYNNLK